MIFPVGHLVAVDLGLYEHVGISDGEGGIYENSNTRDGRGLVTYDEFSKGKKIIDLGILPGCKLSPNEIIEKCKHLIQNSKTYNVLANNCEHFVREVCDVEIKSPQVQKALFAGVASSIALNSNNSQVSYTALGVAAGSMLSKSGEDTLKNSLIGGSIGLILSLLLEDKSK